MNKKIPHRVGNRDLTISILRISISIPTLTKLFGIGTGSISIVTFLLFDKTDRRAEVSFYPFISDSYWLTNFQCSDKNFVTRSNDDECLKVIK